MSLDSTVDVSRFKVANNFLKVCGFLKGIYGSNDCICFVFNFVGWVFRDLFKLSTVTKDTINFLKV